MPADGAASLMSDKERSYVAHCFSKMANQRGVSIDFERVMGGERISYDLRAAKQETALKFGKISRRSKKWMRPSLSTETPFLERPLLLSDLFEMAAVMKWIILDEENLTAMEDAIYAQLASIVGAVINDRRTFAFLTELFSFCSPKTKSKTLALLVTNSGAITEAEGLLGFLRPEISAIPDTPDLDLGRLWGSAGGYALGTCLLVKRGLVQPIVESFVGSEVTVAGYLPEFLERLAVSDIGPEDVQRIRAKLESLDDEGASELSRRLFS